MVKNFSTFATLLFSNSYFFALVFVFALLLVLSFKLLSVATGPVLIGGSAAEASRFGEASEASAGFFETRFLPGILKI